MKSCSGRRVRIDQVGARRRIIGRLVGIVALSFLLGACGGGGGAETASVSDSGVPISGGTKFVASTGTSAVNGLPAVDVVDLSDGSTVNLASAAPSDKTLVLWFWAPH